MSAPARTARAGAWVSVVATALRWAMRVSAAGALGATVAPIALAPEVFAACVPPEASSMDLRCLGEAGLGLAATLGILAGILGILSAAVRSYQERVEDRLVAAEIRAIASRNLGDSA